MRQLFAIADDVRRMFSFAKGRGPIPGQPPAPFSCSRIGQIADKPSLKLFPAALVSPRRGSFRRAVAAFTLVEAMLAVGIMGLFLAACLTAIVIDQVAIRKAKEEALVMNFLTKYVENLKALDFSTVVAGQPINNLYNGVSPAATINIPANNTWVPIDTTDYQNFYSDLWWLQNRNPKMMMIMTQNSVAGTVHDKQINLKVDWDAPLRRGGRLEVQVDVLRTVNVPNL